MQPEFLHILQIIRTEYGKPMIISSGYRDSTHPDEAKKKTPGEHFYGLAADIKVSGVDAQKLISIAYKNGIRRIGISQNPNTGYFVHLGYGDKLEIFHEATWTY